MIPEHKQKVQITLTKELVKQAEQQADKEERTLSNLISIALKKYLAEAEKND